LQRFGIKLGLDTIRHVLQHLDDPHQHYRCIHIAGTNGKGSVAAMLTAILQACGFKTGMYTSPHLVRFNERIQVNQRMISDADVMAAYDVVRSIPPANRELTFFEMTTAMALYEFQRRQVDWAVIETGMGGRLDATNILQPAAAVITNVSIEHRQYLGSTIEAIAGEKAGIIKAGIPVVTGVRQKAARRVIEAVARRKRCPLHLSGRDFHTRSRPDGGFDYSGIQHRWKGLHTSLIGRHQLANSALALATCEALEDEIRFSENAVRNGLQNTRWPGRLEWLGRKPPILLDGAHNRHAASALAGYLQSSHPDRDITLVVGILDDKPYRSMLRTLVPVCRRIVVTRPRIDRALPPEILCDEVKAMTANVEIQPDVASAVEHAVDATPADGIVCIAGSLYVVGEAKEALAARNPTLTSQSDFTT